MLGVHKIADVSFSGNVGNTFILTSHLFDFISEECRSVTDVEDTVNDHRMRPVRTFSFGDVET